MSASEQSTVQTANQRNADIQFFNENGFLGPIKLYEPEQAKAILQKIRLNNLERSHILFDNDVNYDRHFDIPELTQHIGHPTIVEKISSILGQDILCWRSEFFPKFPKSSGTEWHQVSNYQYATGTPMLRPTLENYSGPLDLTVWTAFTEATIENGCMKFLPGSHKKLYYDESKDVGRGRTEQYRSVTADSDFFGYDFQEFKIDKDWIPDENEAVSMVMQPGECVIFSARCVHGSHPNVTERNTRFAITARYTPTHVKVYSGMDTFQAHGSFFDLSNYGCVLVSGEDHYKHNKIRTENNLGERFPTPANRFVAP
ncbi:MAG: chlorinating enzyme [Limnobacter sp.]|nr:chlorinating enzyme [Limnobacter sp.]